MYLYMTWKHPEHLGYRIEFCERPGGLGFLSTQQLLNVQRQKLQHYKMFTFYKGMTAYLMVKFVANMKYGQNDRQ
jgi:hypothetical protein